jgi:hypothetical protein
VLHADGYAGFSGLFETGRIIEAGCWTHVRRKFFDVHAATALPIANEALDRIGQLYAVEQTINGSPADQRQQQRQLKSKPIAEGLTTWAEETLPKRSRRSELAAAFRYMLGALAGTVPLLQRRPSQPRQQSGRTRPALRRHRPQELSLCRIRCRGGALLR